MYVCVCNALNAETLRSLAAQGLSFDEIQAVTNCAGNCGSCLEFAESIIESTRRRPIAECLPLLSPA